MSYATVPSDAGAKILRPPLFVWWQLFSRGRVQGRKPLDPPSWLCKEFVRRARRER